MSLDLLHGQDYILSRWAIAIGIGKDPLADGGPEEWSVFTAKEPEGEDIPDNIITFYDTAGIVDSKNEDGDVTEYYGFQARVRADAFSQVQGKTRMILVRNRLDKIKRYKIQIDGIWYIIHTVKRGSIIPLGQEEEAKSRWGWTLNGTITLSRLGD